MRSAVFQVSSRAAFRLLSLLAYAPLCALPSPASAEQATKSQAGIPHAMLSDPRLDALVTLEEVGISLGELFTKLSRPGLRLEVVKDHADLKVQVRLKGRPLRVVMASLSETLPGYWEATQAEKGYTLFLSSAARRKRDEWWSLFLGEREKALAAVRAAVLNRMRGGAQPTRNDGGPGEPSSPEGTARFAAERRFFRSLPATLQEEVARQIANEHTLGIPGMGFGSGDEEGAVSVAFADLPDAAQDQLRRCAAFSAHFPDASFPQSVVYLANGGFTVYASVRSRQNSFAAALDVPLPPESLPLDMYHGGLAEFVRRAKGNSPASWKRLAEYSESRVWKNTLPPDFRVTGPAPLRRDTLEWLGRAADMEFISDYHSKPGMMLTPEEKKARLKRPLEEELNHMAAQSDLSWKRRQEGVYLFRSNRWHRDDLLEVPDKMLRKWQAARAQTQQAFADAGGPASRWSMEQRKPLLDLHAEFVTSLTNWQLVCGLSGFVPLKASGGKEPVGHLLSAGLPKYSLFAAPFSFDVETILPQYRTTLFYASLNDAARTALLQQRLAFASLTLPQREQALYLIPVLRERLVRGSATPLMLGLQPKGGNGQVASPHLPQSMRLVLATP